MASLSTLEYLRFITSLIGGQKGSLRPIRSETSVWTLIYLSLPLIRRQARYLLATWLEDCIEVCGGPENHPISEVCEDEEIDGYLLTDNNGNALNPFAQIEERMRELGVK